MDNKSKLGMADKTRRSWWLLYLSPTEYNHATIYTLLQLAQENPELLQARLAAILNQECTGLKSAMSSFNWGNTNEGEGFWFKVANRTEKDVGVVPSELCKMNEQQSGEMIEEIIAQMPIMICHNLIDCGDASMPKYWMSDNEGVAPEESGPSEKVAPTEEQIEEVKKELFKEDEPEEILDGTDDPSVAPQRMRHDKGLETALKTRQRWLEWLFFPAEVDFICMSLSDNQKHLLESKQAMQVDDALDFIEWHNVLELKAMRYESMRRRGVKSAEDINLGNYIEVKHMLIQEGDKVEYFANGIQLQRSEFLYLEQIRDASFPYVLRFLVPSLWPAEPMGETIRLEASSDEVEDMSRYAIKDRQEKPDIDFDVVNTPQAIKGAQALRELQGSLKGAKADMHFENEAENIERSPVFKRFSFEYPDEVSDDVQCVIALDKVMTEFGVMLDIREQSAVVEWFNTKYGRLIND